ncbi:MAG: saccharopine dehydrogenase [Corynebacteriales bacterium]|nr:saccharopine dehydrogenase [Mycobacteriales bacterium]
MRNETLADETGAPIEHRAPLIPEHAGALINMGVGVTVEESSHRVFPSEHYRAVGCTIVEAGSWTQAPAGTVIIGLKALPVMPPMLTHQHVFFGHAFKGQIGAQDLLDRFRRGGGELFDLEELTDAAGKRLTTFGFWAGYVGAALAVLQARGHITKFRRPMTKEALDALLRMKPGEDAPDPHADRALVIGARGRSGQGAQAALLTAGIAVTAWNRPETAGIADRRAEVLEHSILVNAIATRGSVPPFVLASEVDNPTRRLRTIADVTCDMNGELNALRDINTTTTSWATPVRHLQNLDVIAIDNLPSALPVEASHSFSTALSAHLPLWGRTDVSSPWHRALQVYRQFVPTRSFGQMRTAGISTLLPDVPQIGFAS